MSFRTGTAHCNLCARERSSPFCFCRRWKAIAQYTVSDAFLDMRIAEGLAYMYTDYTIEAQRVDELWNLPSIYGTPMYGIGIVADHHLVTPVKTSHA